MQTGWNGFSTFAQRTSVYIVIMKQFCLSTALWLFTAVASPVMAGMMQPVPVEALATNAEVVIHGKVIGKTVQRDPEGRIYTRVQLEITEVWKGNVSPEFTIVHGGGRIGNEESRASIQVSYEIGEEVVAFLRRNHRGEGVTVGMVQGKFHVESEPSTGVKVASNAFHGRAENTAVPGPAGPSLQNRLTLDELRARSNAGGAR